MDHISSSLPKSTTEWRNYLQEAEHRNFLTAHLEASAIVKEATALTGRVNATSQAPSLSAHVLAYAYRRALDCSTLQDAITTFKAKCDHPSFFVPGGLDTHLQQAQSIQLILHFAKKTPQTLQELSDIAETLSIDQAALFTAYTSHPSVIATVEKHLGKLHKDIALAKRGDQAFLSRYFEKIDLKSTQYFQASYKYRQTAEKINALIQRASSLNAEEREEFIQLAQTRKDQFTELKTAQAAYHTACCIDEFYKNYQEELGEEIFTQLQQTSQLFLEYQAPFKEVHQTRKHQSLLKMAPPPLLPPFRYFRTIAQTMIKAAEQSDLFILRSLFSELNQYRSPLPNDSRSSQELFCDQLKEQAPSLNEKDFLTEVVNSHQSLSAYKHLIINALESLIRNLNS